MFSLQVEGSVTSETRDTTYKEENIVITHTQGTIALSFFSLFSSQSFHKIIRISQIVLQV